MSSKAPAGASEPVDLDWLRGARVLVTGGGISGLAVVRALVSRTAGVTLTDSKPGALAQAAALGASTLATGALSGDLSALDGFDLVVTSPGWRPDSPVLIEAIARRIPVWGDVELAWKFDRAEVLGAPRRWLAITGTNGKTTTTAMVASILEAAAIPSAACGNIGLPILDALALTPPVHVLAVELSSFQLHWAPSVRPEAGVILNIAEDHLDWHGSMQAYTDAKAQVLSGRVGVLGLDDPIASQLASGSHAGRTVGFRLGAPASGELGVVEGVLVDRAFGPGPDGEALLPAEEVTPPGPSGLMDALAAAALTRAVGVSAAQVRAGLRAYTVGPHRAALVTTTGGVAYIDDSKATNPHAARSSILAHPRVVWIAGGLLKGAHVDGLVEQVADRLVGAVLIGRDATQIADALARHAPDVPTVRLVSGDDAGVTERQSDLRVAPPRTVDGGPDAVMAAAVHAAAGMAAPGDVVLLAPAAASLDMFDDYGHRGRSFAAAATDLDSGAGT